MKKALLVLDFINGIATTGSCQTYLAQHPEVVNNTNQLIDYCQKNGISTFFVRLAFDENYTNCPKHSKMFTWAKDNKRFLLGTPDTEFVDALHYKRGTDQVINKPAVSPFYTTSLEEQLKKMGIEELIITGLATDNAVNLVTREAHDKGFYTVVVQDACGASTAEVHNSALALLAKIAGEVSTTEACLARLKEEASAVKKNNPSSMWQPEKEAATTNTTGDGTEAKMELNN